MNVQIKVWTGSELLKEHVKEHLVNIQRSLHKMSFQAVCTAPRKISTAPRKNQSAKKSTPAQEKGGPAYTVRGLWLREKRSASCVHGSGSVVPRQKMTSCAHGSGLVVFLLQTLSCKPVQYMKKSDWQPCHGNLRRLFSCFVCFIPCEKLMLQDSNFAQGCPICGVFVSVLGRCTQAGSVCCRVASFERMCCVFPRVTRPTAK